MARQKIFDVDSTSWNRGSGGTQRSTGNWFRWTTADQSSSERNRPIRVDSAFAGTLERYLKRVIVRQATTYRIVFHFANTEFAAFNASRATEDILNSIETSGWFRLTFDDVNFVNGVRASFDFSPSEDGVNVDTSEPYSWDFTGAKRTEFLAWRNQIVVSRNVTMEVWVADTKAALDGGPPPDTTPEVKKLYLGSAKVNELYRGAAEVRKMYFGQTLVFHR